MFNPYYDLFRILEAAPEELRRASRKKLIWPYAWAVPSPEAIQAIAALGPEIVEMGAGTGYWAWLLGQAGCRVQAFERETGQPPRWVELQKGGPEVLARSQAQTLLLCWPPLQEPFALECLRAFRGERVVYIGEGKDGCTADEAFHVELDALWQLEQSLNIPQWPGSQDQVFIYRRKRESEPS